MSKLKQLAAQVSGSSPLTIGREKLTSDQVCSYDKLTIKEYDWISYPDETTGVLTEYPVLIFEEIEDGFYCGGQALRNLCKAISADEGCLEEFKESGLPVKFTKTTTKKNQTYINFTVLASDDDE